MKCVCVSDQSFHSTLDNPVVHFCMYVNTLSAGCGQSLYQTKNFVSLCVCMYVCVPAVVVIATYEAVGCRFVFESCAAPRASFPLTHSQFNVETHTHTMANLQSSNLQIWQIKAWLIICLENW